MTAPTGSGLSVIVVGGGVAGLSCAIRLAAEGVAVTLLETRKKLGGRATSFDDARTGDRLDNCQHVAMGCCVNYLDLCARMGVTDKLRWTTEINWLEEGGRRSVWKPAAFLPAPAHFAPSFLASRFLTVGEKGALALGMREIARTNLDEWRDQTFGEWLCAHEQPGSVIDKVWSPIVVSACNLDVNRVCAATALYVFQGGFLGNRVASEIGVSAAPLVELYDPAISAIEGAGGVIRLGASAVRMDETSVTLASGETLHADRTVCALPFERVGRVVDAAVRQRDERFSAVAKLEHSSILGVHLWFDRAVMGELPHAVLVGRGTQWLFRKSDVDESSGARTEHVHAVVSAADEWMSFSEEVIGKRVLADVRACLPAAREAELVRVRAVKEKLATFAPTPEAERARPETTGTSRIILAGDYVQTGWPATMEGAARSGYLAAAAVLERDEEWALSAELRESALYRALRVT